MKTTHRLCNSDARCMAALPSASVDLVVTSPPYPMIAMWDDLFTGQDPRIAADLGQGRPGRAFERMHGLLDPVWQEVFRVLKPGGFACINVGDATRTCDGSFALYPNHARILQCLTRTGFTILPDILWRKPTNAPNKFMGSGMLPAGAYVTLEHEYILIARKGGKRRFVAAEEKRLRRESAIFWEERNLFFSDVWTDVRGAAQVLADGEARTRSAAFPFEVAYRLISMYAIKGDLVLDPFWGTGTTTLAAMAAARNSIGFEIEAGLAQGFEAPAPEVVDRLNACIDERLERHVRFAAERLAARRPLAHRNRVYGFPVMTGQERELMLNPVAGIERRDPTNITVVHGVAPQAVSGPDQWGPGHSRPAKPSGGGGKTGQLDLF